MITNTVKTVNLLLSSLTFAFSLFVVIFYGYLIVDTIKRLFRNSLKIAPKIFFCVSAIMPFIAATGIVLMAMSQSFPSCPNLDALSFINLRQNIMGAGSYIIIASPFILLGVILSLKRKENENGKKIYKRAIYILILSILISGSILLNSFNSARTKSYDASVRNILTSVLTQNELYRYDHGDKYPIITGLTAAERWNALRKVYKQEGYHDLPDHRCYEKTKDPRYQFDYRNSPDGLHYVSTILLTVHPNLKLFYWCIDDTGISKEVSSLPDSNQYSCSQ